MKLASLPVWSGSRWTLSTAIPAPSSSGVRWHELHDSALGPVSRRGTADEVCARHAREALALPAVRAHAVERVELRLEQLVTDLEGELERLVGAALHDQVEQLELLGALVRGRLVQCAHQVEVGHDRPAGEAGRRERAGEEKGLLATGGRSLPGMDDGQVFPRCACSSARPSVRIVGGFVQAATEKSRRARVENVDAATGLAEGSSVTSRLQEPRAMQRAHGRRTVGTSKRMRDPIRALARHGCRGASTSSPCSNRTRACSSTSPPGSA